jgi:hypothetical protein
LRIFAPAAGAVSEKAFGAVASRVTVKVAVLFAFALFVAVTVCAPLAVVDPVQL